MRMRKTYIYVMYIYPLRKHYTATLLGFHLISTSNWKIDIKDSQEICLDVHKKICSIQSQRFLSLFSSHRKPTIRSECSQPSHTCFFCFQPQSTRCQKYNYPIKLSYDHPRTKTPVFSNNRPKIFNSHAQKKIQNALVIIRRLQRTFVILVARRNFSIAYINPLRRLHIFAR